MNVKELNQEISDYINNRTDEWNVSRFVNKLNAFDEGVMIDLIRGFYHYKLSEITEEKIVEMGDELIGEVKILFDTPHGTANKYKPTYQESGVKWLIEQLSKAILNLLKEE